MSDTKNDWLLERRVGIVGECGILGLVAVIALAGFLSMIGNPLPASLLVGAVLGGIVVGLRYLLGVAVRQFRSLISIG